MNMLQWFDDNHPEIGQEIEEKKVLTDELIQQIVQAAETFKAEF